MFKIATIIGISAVLLIGGFIISPMDATEYTEPQYNLEMEVGDSFEYRPETNLPCEFTVTGTGIIGDAVSIEGAFLSFEDGVISGTATDNGTYQITVCGTWVCPEDESLIQRVYQYITLTVGEDVEETITNSMILSNKGGWNLCTEPHINELSSIIDTEGVVSTDSPEKNNDYEVIAIVCAMMGVFLLGTLVGRKN